MYVHHISCAIILRYKTYVLTKIPYSHTNKQYILQPSDLTMRIVEIHRFASDEDLPHDYKNKAFGL